MTTEIISDNPKEGIVVEAGYFYAISKEGNVVRFKPGRKKKEMPSPIVAEAVVAGELPVAEVSNESLNPVTN